MLKFTNFIFFTLKSKNFVRKLSLDRIITPETLKEVIDKKIDQVKILDCTYTFGPKPDYETFMKLKYGKFDKLMKESSESKEKYLEQHIQSSIFFDMNCALYPGKYERFSFYNKNEFEEYPKLLGINKDDHLICYSRGSGGGNTFAGRCFRIFQMYGHKNISLLSGGFDKWKDYKFPIVNGEEKKITKGDWCGIDKNDIIITFEELEKKDSYGKCIFDKVGSSITMLDARNEEEFENSHIRGANSFPVNKLINTDGTLKSKYEIMEIITIKKINISNPIITYCVTGNLASLLSVILENIVLLPNRTYNGSIYEIEARDPSKLTS
ncbi:Sulfurtransferase [Strongyloides ratti]|uniref:Sulfurtransferase n=1 Tax=Strongyloides ratti TaxID=34506 RepID=A0A090LSE8_STRRB|nr:Sulfurtransferase [Strongyloides ratti]CEF70533.1 Sulfurtransferase [Strongyloides ratti]